MPDGVTDQDADAPETPAEDARLAPPARRGSREERREATLRALAAGEEARCAYCGQPLPPLPPKGGRPTPYCPADPERYGQWGAKTITCAMLDEHREIWVRVYGTDQPMTQLDVHTLDQRLAALLAVLDPVRAEVAALQTHTTGELASALTARENAEAERHQAVEAAQAAQARSDQAVADAETARAEAAGAREAQAAAEKQAHDATAERDQAVAERGAAHQDAETARTDRQHALDQLAEAHQRVAELQATLASERASALERVDQLRREDEQARHDLRTSLTEQWQQRLAAQAEEFTQRLREAQTAADQRVAELTDQLTHSTQNYADSLAPLHAELATLRGQLAEQTTTATAAQRQLDQLRDNLTHAVAESADDGSLRQRLRALAASGAATTSPPRADEDPPP